MNFSEKERILGTAQWGWNVDKNAAFRILDAWMEAGLRAVDAATNYPINQNPADFRRSEQILQEYIRANGLSDLRITMKIGSLDNLRGPTVNLVPSFIQMLGEEYLRLFGPNLNGLMFHWDNRQDAAAIQTSLEALVRFCAMADLQPGLSGIAHPEVYAQIPLLQDTRFVIELKHNVLHSDLARYQPLLGKQHRFWAYGINAGGLKLDAHYPENSTLSKRGGPSAPQTALMEQLNQWLLVWNAASRPPITNMNQIGLVYAALHGALDGILLGVSSEKQLQETLSFYQSLQYFDYSDVFKALQQGKH